MQVSPTHALVLISFQLKLPETKKKRFIISFYGFHIRFSRISMKLCEVLINFCGTLINFCEILMAFFLWNTREFQQNLHGFPWNQLVYPFHPSSNQKTPRPNIFHVIFQCLKNMMKTCRCPHKFVSKRCRFTLKFRKLENIERTEIKMVNDHFIYLKFLKSITNLLNLQIQCWYFDNPHEKDLTYLFQLKHKSSSYRFNNGRSSTFFSLFDIIYVLV